MSNPDTIPQWQTIEQIQAEHRVAHNRCQACVLLAYIDALPEAVQGLPQDHSYAPASSDVWDGFEQCRDAVLALLG